MYDMEDIRKKSYFIKGRQTYLRGIIEDDYHYIANCVNDPEFNKFLQQGWKSVNKEDVRNQFENEKKIESAIQFAQCKIDTEKIVGWCGLYKWDIIPGSVEIRSFVGTEYWGKGYGTEQYAMLLKIGFERYNMNRIFFGTHYQNKGTERIYEKIGAFQEGVLREITYRGGKYNDANIFSILRREYDKKVRNLCEPYLS